LLEKLHHAWLPALTAGGERCRHHRELYRRHQDVALAHPSVEGVAGKPDHAVPLALPVTGGPDARALPRQVDAGTLTETEVAAEGMHQVDGHPMGQVVVIGIAGFDDGLAQVHRLAVAPTDVVPVAAAVT